jgi:hypothetical protein
MPRFYPEPTLPKNTVASFEKAAILGFFGRTLPKYTGRVSKYLLKPLADRFTPTALARAVQPATRGLEKGISAAGHRFLSPERARTFDRVMRGVPQNTARDIASNALIGGVFEGGLGAAMADSGERGDAFMHGLGSGAVSGAAFGAISGPLAQMARNTRGIHMSGLAQRHGLSRPEMAKQVKGMGTWDALKGSFGKTDDLNRQIARHKIVGGAGQIGAEIALPMMLMPGEHTPDAPPPPAAPSVPSLQPNAPAVYAQPQGFKGGSVNYSLRPIDLTKMPSYHR